MIIKLVDKSGIVFNETIYYGEKIIIGKGVSITKSDDMGIYIHYESLSGGHSTMFLGNTDDTPGHRWAEELFREEG